VTTYGVRLQGDDVMVEVLESAAEASASAG